MPNIITPWQWQDSADVPLNEQVEAYTVSFGAEFALVGFWEVSAPELLLDATSIAALLAASPGGLFRIAQRGDRDTSAALLIAPN